jgi:hypothetical protein
MLTSQQVSAEGSEHVITQFRCPQGHVLSPMFISGHSFIFMSSIVCLQLCQRMENVSKVIEETLAKRIMFLDGGMGTMIQRETLTEEDFRGSHSS